MTEDRFLRLKDILGDKSMGTQPIIPISKSAWWSGVSSGRYPKPVKLGRVSVWRASEIARIVAS
jgi:prophage regulatory protein